MTVRQFLSSVSSSEITEWIAYFNLKHQGDPEDAKAQLTKIFGSKIKKKGKHK